MLGGQLLKIVVRAAMVNRAPSSRLATIEPLPPNQVEGALDYLGKVSMSWSGIAKKKPHAPHLGSHWVLNECDHVVLKADIPMYSTPRGRLCEPPPQPEPQSVSEEENEGRPERKRKFSRAADRAIKTMRKKFKTMADDDIKKDHHLISTLENLLQAKKELMKRS